MEPTLRLQPRLLALSQAVPQNARLVDVGTDHGYLPIALLQKGQLTSAIATDIAREPLAHARRSADEYGVTLDLRLCNGLAGVMPEEVDTVVIAGMGGETIAAILEAAPWTKNGTLLLLQPMTKAEVLRRWLFTSGYTIQKEQLVEDKGHLYPLLTAMGGEPPPWNQKTLWVGTAVSDPLYKNYVAERLHQIGTAICGLRRSTSPESMQTLRELEALAAQIQEGAEI